MKKIMRHICEVIVKGSSVLCIVSLALSLPLYAEAAIDTTASVDTVATTTNRGWNFNSMSDGSGTTTTQIHAKWINYLGSDRTFKDIDTNFVQTKDGFIMDNAPFTAMAPLYADGVSTFRNDNRYDNKTDSIIEVEALDMDIVAEGAKHIEGSIIHGDLMTDLGLVQNVSYVLYEHAYETGADLIYYVHNGVGPRLQKLVRFNSREQVFNPSFTITFSDDVDFRVLNARDGTQYVWDKHNPLELGEWQSLSFDANAQRQTSFRNFRVWDSTVVNEQEVLNERRVKGTEVQKGAFIGLRFEPQNPDGSYTFTKIIPDDFLSENITYPIYTDTSSTFYPDANPESTTVDGDIKITTGTWSGAHDATSGDIAFPSGNFSYPGSSYIPSYVIQRTFILFNSASIPDTDTISSASISLRISDKSVEDNDAQAYINIYSSSPASNTNLVVGDYDQVGTTAYATSKTISSITTPAFNTWTLNASGIAAISKTGVSKFSVREGHDAENVSISTIGNPLNYIEMATAESANDPYLTVIHLGSDPDAPTDLTTTSNTGEVSLSWTAPASPGFSELETYGIFRDTTSSATTLLASIATTSTTYSDTTAVHGTIYYYRVTATNGEPATSTYSNERSSGPNSGRVIRLGGLLGA